MVDVLSWWGGDNRRRVGGGPTRPAPRGELVVLCLAVVFLAIDGSALPVELAVRLGTLSRGEHAAVASIFDGRAVDACGIPFELQGFPLGQLLAVDALSDSPLLPLLPLNNRPFRQGQARFQSQGTNAYGEPLGELFHVDFLLCFLLNLSLL